MPYCRRLVELLWHPVGVTRLLRFRRIEPRAIEYPLWASNGPHTAAIALLQRVGLCRDPP